MTPMRHHQAEQLRRNRCTQSSGVTPTTSRRSPALGRRWRPHKSFTQPQPGYAGSIVVDDGQHFIAVNLWQSEHDAAAGRAAIGTQVQRLLEPLMATPAQLLGAGEVVATNLADHR